MIPISSDDLRIFCGLDGNRFDLSAPFARDGWLYAGDGSIIVRIPTKYPDCQLPRIPKCPDELFVGFPRCSRPWPKIEPVRFVVRPCNGCESELVLEFFTRPVTKVGRKALSSIYLDLIARLDKVRYNANGPNEDAVYFTASGDVQGIVMKITEP